MTYQITLSRRQMECLADGMEFFSRFIAGQLEYLPEILKNQGCEFHELVHRKLMLKKTLFPDLATTESRGIGWSEDPIQQEIQISYELYRDVRVQFRKEERSNESQAEVSSVYDRETLHYSDQPKMVILAIPTLPNLSGFDEDKRQSAMEEDPRWQAAYDTLVELHHQYGIPVPESF